MRVRCGAILAVAALAALPAALASPQEMAGADGRLRITLDDGSVPLRTHAIFAPGPAGTALLDHAAGSGWGACAGMAAAGPGGGGSGGSCAGPSGAAPITWQGDLLVTEHQEGALSVRHEWRPTKEGVEARVAVTNLGLEPMDGVRYRRSWATGWSRDGVAVEPVRTMGGASPPHPAVEYSIDVAGIEPSPRAWFAQRAGSESANAACAYRAHLGPGSASRGLYFEDARPGNDCGAGATVQLHLGSLDPGATAGFRMVFAASGSAADAAAWLEGLGIDLWFVVEEPASMPAPAPVAVVWGIDGLPGVAPAAGSGSGWQPSPGTDGGQEGPTGGPGMADGDADGVQDAADSCPADPNPDQMDSDLDGVGDVCDAPSPAAQEAPAPPGPAPPAAPSVSSLGPVCPSGADLDADGLSDLCDPDRDGDLVADQLAPPGTYLDNCPLHRNPGQEDTDGDGAGDACSRPVRLLAAPGQGASGLVVAQQAPPRLGPALALAGLAALAAAAVPPRSRSWLTAGLVGLFTRMSADQVLENPNRSLALQLVQANPGMHVEELARGCSLSRGATMHHVRVLQRAGKLRTVRAAGRILVFANAPGTVVPPAQDLAVQHPSARRVLDIIRTEPGITVRELADRTGLEYGAAHYHVKRFQSMGWVRLASEDGPVRVHPLAEAHA